MKSSLINSIGEVVTDYGARVMKVFKKGLLGRSLFDFYGDIKADTLRTNESSAVPGTPADGKGGVIYTKSADGKLYYKSNEVSEIELSANGGHTDEDIQDLVGAMVTSNTESGITVAYQDGDGTIDLVVDEGIITPEEAESDEVINNALEISEKMFGGYGASGQGISTSDYNRAARALVTSLGKSLNEDHKDHEVSMAQSSLNSILRSAMELKAKIGNQEIKPTDPLYDKIMAAVNGT